MSLTLTLFGNHFLVAAQQLARVSLNSTKVTPVDGDPPTREEIKELEEGLKVKGDDEVMVFKKKVLQELLNEVLKKAREREREKERERLKDATAEMAKQNPQLLTTITRQVEEKRQRETKKGAQLTMMIEEGEEEEREAEEIEGQDRQPRKTFSWGNTLSPSKRNSSPLPIKNLNL